MDLIAKIPANAKHTIKDLRVRAGITQSQAAKLLGVSEPTLRNWEKDSSGLKYEKMVRISEIYNIPLDYIFFGQDNAFCVTS